MPDRQCWPSPRHTLESPGARALTSSPASFLGPASCYWSGHSAASRAMPTAPPLGSQGRGPLLSAPAAGTGASCCILAGSESPRVPVPGQAASGNMREPGTCCRCLVTPRKSTELSRQGPGDSSQGLRDRCCQAAWLTSSERIPRGFGRGMVPIAEVRPPQVGHTQGGLLL